MWASPTMSKNGCHALKNQQVSLLAQNTGTEEDPKAALPNGRAAFTRLCVSYKPWRLLVLPECQAEGTAATVTTIG